ncbi:hypothetical protein ASZ90_011782 [hydrocarbon metagenome]|uniref:Uncharacterized protein n=1 Tax=hydrocarbon metagenome TaxID=938273 RepID=A0A0W8FD58_9ZZZZ
MEGRHFYSIIGWMKYILVRFSANANRLEVDASSLGYV